MKTPIKIFLISLLSFFLIQPVQGQKLLNRLKEKAKNKIEKKLEEKAEEKAEEKIDEKLEEITEDKKENKSSEKSQEEKAQKRMQGLLKGFGISSEPVPIADNYYFDHLIQMHIESFEKTGEISSQGEFITHLNPKTKSMAYQVVSGDMGNPGQGMFIIDAENGATIILNDENNEKTGIVYGMGAFFESLGEKYEEEALEETSEMYLANPNVKKTGRSKTIAGYKCDEYTYSDENSKSNIWITKNLKMNTQDYFSTLFKASLYSHGMPWGYVMETTSLDINSGEKTTMKVTKVNTNSNVKFSMNNYQLTNLGSFQMPVEE